MMYATPQTIEAVRPKERMEEYNSRSTWNCDQDVLLEDHVDSVLLEVGNKEWDAAVTLYPSQVRQMRAWLRQWLLQYGHPLHCPCSSCNL